MRARISLCLTALTVIALLALPGRVAAQQHRDARYPYILIDLGTFGGPNSYISTPSPLITDQGTVIGAADTMTTDPFCFIHPPDCNASPTFAWRNGVLTNLGALAGGGSSVPNWISPNGLIVGPSENGLLDPLTGQPEFRATLWAHGTVQDLGTFGGNWSVANAVNDRGQVVGVATTAIPDSFPAALNAFGFFDFPYPGWGATQNRAFLWQHGQMQDLGTLGGTYAQAVAINAGGHVAGLSTTTAITNPTTGLPTVHPFVWDQGTMRDLGTLGGTFAFPNGIDDRGDVIGTSTLAGDQAYHPFLWTQGRLIDLGTFGGDAGQTHWINQAGDVAGWALTTGDATVDAALWMHGRATPIDLGTLPGQTCTFADMVNAQDQVVGGSCTNNAVGLLWEHGTISDVNTLVAPSAIHVTEAHAINDHGEIVATGVFPNGNQHVVLLVPSGLAASEGLSSNVPAPGATGPATGPLVRPRPCEPLLPRHARATWGPHLPCLGG